VGLATFQRLRERIAAAPVHPAGASAPEPEHIIQFRKELSMALSKAEQEAARAAKAEDRVIELEAELAKLKPQPKADEPEARKRGR
jgi:hypothetical protein